MSKSRCVVGLSGIAFIVSGMMATLPLAGWAQDVDEMIVRTRKKEENVQDIPIAVDLITADQIARKGIANVSDITSLSPSVQFDQSFGPQDVRIAVRGLSNTRGRSNVAFLVDGIDVTTENFVSAGSGLLANQRLLNDLEAVEIVKGPQSSLYGRAAFAGAISYITKEPGDELESVVRLEAGDDGLMTLDGSIGGPVKGLEGILGLRASGTYWTDDGSYTNQLSGNGVGGQEGFGGALTAVWTPKDSIKVKSRVEYSDSQFEQRAVVRVGGGTDGERLELVEYPAEGLTFLGQGSNTATGLANFGQYCPDELKDPSRGPGFCLPKVIDPNGRLPTFSEDPLTGTDLQGTDTQLLRATVQANLDQEYGAFSVNVGWIDYDAFDELDQDYQALGTNGVDQLKAHQLGRGELETNQFSAELRFASSFEGPLNFTVGGLYWEEDRRFEESNSITSCIEFSKTAVGGGAFAVWPDPAAFDAGICDGSPGIVSSWQERALDLYPCQYDATGTPIPDPATGTCARGEKLPAPWRAETEHFSAYLNVEWQMSETWLLGVEGRYVNEDFDLLRTSFSACTNLMFFLAPGALEPSNVTSANQDIVCVSQARLDPNLPQPTPSATGDDWFLLEGSTNSNYTTPKVYLQWQPTDDAQFYMSWGTGQKPGGINQLAAGGSNTTIADERFDSEKVDAWELGAKTNWNLFGGLQINSAIFLNDYTDKQVGTQVVSATGELQPRVVNAAAAQVWGWEFELVYAPEFLEGFTLRTSYTRLEAEFTEFFDDTRSLIRSAAVGSCEKVDKGGTSSTAPTSFCRLDLSGNQLERVPENALTGQLDYTNQFFDQQFDYFIEFSYRFEDERFIDVDNFTRFEDYWIADLRGGFEAENWEFLVYVTNLFDDDTAQTGGSGPDFAKQVSELGFTAGFGVSHYFGVLPDPRSFGAKLTLRF